MESSKRRSSHLLGACLFVAVAMPAQAQEGWTSYRGADGLFVQYPAGIVGIDAGPTERGSGKRFKSEDGRYEFAAYSLERSGGETPRVYLRRNLIVDPASIVYRRVTDRFFVVSSIRNDRIFYSRCNFSRRIQCIYLEYPKAEKARWDRIVTRISHSLRPRG